jgi:hypothetical protein
MPSKLPAPVAGTAEQADPNVVWSIIAPLPEAMADGIADGIAEGIAEGIADAAAGAVEPPALEHAPTNAAAMRRPAKAPKRLRLFTWFSCVVDRA